MTAWQLFHGEHPWTSRASRDSTQGAAPEQDSGGAQTGQPQAGGQAPPPWSSGGLPRTVRDAFIRGLDPDPQRRWPSMRALQAALRVRPGPSRWIALAMPVAAVLVTGGLIATSGTNELCADAGQPADEAWASPRRDAVALALDVPGYARVRTRALTELDAWAEGWSEEVGASCRATLVEHSQSPELQDLRGACYRDTLAGFGAAVEALSEPGENTLLHAHDVLAGLPDLSPCSDVPGLNDEPFVPPALRDLDERGRADIQRAQVLSRAGRDTDALELLDALDAELSDTGLSRLQIRALVVRAGVQTAKNDNVAALQGARAALGLALTHDDNAVLDDALVLLVGLLGHELSSPAEAEVYATMLEARVQREDIDPGDRRASVASLGLYQVGLGEYETGIETLERALAIHAPARGEGVEFAAILTVLAMAQGYAGRVEDATRNYQRALAIRRTLVGDEHPLIAHTLHGIAQQQRQQGDFEEALATTDEALRILRKTAPQDDTNLSSNAYSRAQALAKLGRVEEEARTAYEASIRHGKRANPGPSRNLATLQMSLARLYAEEFELYEDAVVLADAGLRMHVEVLGERHPDLVISRGRYGQILGRAGRTEDARSEITRALALGTERLGPEHVDTIYVQLLLAGFELRAESFVAAETAAAAAVSALRELAAPPEGMLTAAEGLVRDARAAQGRAPVK